MKLLFIRHAHAEDRKEDLEDKERHLTAEGKEIFQKIMPEFKEKLSNVAKDHLLLWSSPANRALETAEIVAEALQIDIHSTEGFIYEGDFNALSSRIQEVEEAAVLVVGHEPSLSEWTEEMTGERMKIKKGDILQFEVSQKAPLEASLEWQIAAK